MEKYLRLNSGIYYTKNLTKNDFDMMKVNIIISVKLFILVVQVQVLLFYLLELTY
jgi:hypothetical protein